MTPETFLLAVVFGALGGILVSIKTWARVVADIRYHGFDNHLCGRYECPTCRGER